MGVQVNRLTEDATVKCLCRYVVNAIYAYYTFCISLFVANQV